MKELVIRYLLIALYWVPFLGNWLLMRQLDRAEERHDEHIETLIGVKDGRMTINEAGIDTSLETWLAPHFAMSAYDLLTRTGAVNYVEFKLHHKDDEMNEWITVTVQRWDGLTPHEKAAKAVEDRDSALARADKLEAALAEANRLMGSCADFYAVRMEGIQKVAEAAGCWPQIAHVLANSTVGPDSLPWYSKPASQP